MTVQDDSREIELMEVCELQRPGNHSRGGVDAVLPLDGSELEFEIKSTTTGSVTTVRDFGPDHVAKWQGRHWLIGVYSGQEDLRYVLYGSPEEMAPWIKSRSEYIQPDFDLSQLAPAHLELEDL